MTEEITMNCYQWNPRGKPTPKASGVLEVSKVTALVAQVEALSKKIDSLSLLKLVTIMAYETCEKGHTIIDCLIVGVGPGPNKQLDFVGSALHPQGNPFSKPYNPL